MDKQCKRLNEHYAAANNILAEFVAREIMHNLNFVKEDLIRLRLAVSRIVNLRDEAHATQYDMQIVVSEDDMHWLVEIDKKILKLKNYIIIEFSIESNDLNTLCNV